MRSIEKLKKHLGKVSFFFVLFFGEAKKTNKEFISRLKKTKPFWSSKPACRRGRKNEQEELIQNMRVGKNISSSPLYHAPSERHHPYTYNNHVLKDKPDP